MSLDTLKGKEIRLRKSRRFRDKFEPFDWVPTEKKTLESIKIIHNPSGEFVVQKLNSMQDETKPLDQIGEDIVFKGSTLEECVEYLKSQGITIKFVECC